MCRCVANVKVKSKKNIVEFKKNNVKKRKNQSRKNYIDRVRAFEFACLAKL